jgi:hypothetical protein
MSTIELAYAAHGWCAKCKQHGLLFPLHDDKGGPMLCLTCRGAWNAEHGKRRNRGRIVIRAIKAFLNAGGSIRHVDDLKLTALCSEGFGGGIPELEDPLGYLHGAMKPRPAKTSKPTTWPALKTMAKL